jgi:hypothetical protein
VAEVLAGFVIGFAFSILVAPVGAILLINSNQQTGIAQRVAPPGTSVVILSMGLHLLAALLLTMLGLILGLALGGIEDRRPDGGLGSPNLVYTVLVLALTAVLVIPAMLWPWRAYALALAMAFAALFGWAVPWLAEAA